MNRLIALCPADIATGGPEALHQLVATARRLGVDASVLYTPSPRPEVNPAYAHYDVAVTNRIPDQPGVVVVASETAVEYVPTRPGFARWAIWWLSVDNFFTRLGSPMTEPRNDPPLLTWLCSPQSGVVHLTQSHYAREFLHIRGAKSCMLTDFLSDAFVTSARERQRQPKKDLVLYNPRKGVQFTQRLIEATRGQLEFQPIQGLSPDGVAELLGTAKLYIDFGEHPGRDRLPREAVLSGCCVIAGRRGAAGNDIDLPLPHGFSLDEDSPTVVEEFAELALAVMRDFDEITREFDDYRAVVTGQHETFVSETGTFLNSVQRIRMQGYRPSGKRANARRPRR